MISSVMGMTPTTSCFIEISEKYCYSAELKEPITCNLVVYDAFRFIWIPWCSL